MESKTQPLRDTKARIASVMDNAVSLKQKCNALSLAAQRAETRARDVSTELSKQSTRVKALQDKAEVVNKLLIQAQREYANLEQEGKAAHRAVVDAQRARAEAERQYNNLIASVVALADTPPEASASIKIKGVVKRGTKRTLLLSTGEATSSVALCHMRGLVPSIEQLFDNASTGQAGLIKTWPSVNEYMRVTGEDVLEPVKKKQKTDNQPGRAASVSSQSSDHTSARLVVPIPQRLAPPPSSTPPPSYSPERIRPSILRVPNTRLHFGMPTMD